VTVFVILCAVMVAAALACVVTPLLRRHPFDAAADGSPRSLRTAAIAVVSLPLAAAGAYALISNYPWQNPSALAAPQAGGAVDASVEQMIAKLEQRLAQSPGEVEGWRLLGRSYLVTNRPAKAVLAYQKAYDLGGQQDLDVGLDLVEAMLMSNDPALGVHAKEIVDRALAQSPNNPKALWFSGVIAYNANDFATVRTRWTALLAQNPPAEVRAILERQLAELGGSAPAEAGGSAASGIAGAGVPAGASVGAGRSIAIVIDIDPGLRARAPAGTTLFVTARAPGIPGPPLAVVRTATQDWPVDVTLSDANAMIAGRNLSSVDDVEVTARVAFGGTAMTTAGDLLGRAVQKRGETGTLQVTIDTVAP
jgi:cytochrome c-type biogenesis protein CcmH